MKLCVTASFSGICANEGLGIKSLIARREGSRQFCSSVELDWQNLMLDKNARMSTLILELSRCRIERATSGLVRYLTRGACVREGRLRLLRTFYKRPKGALLFPLI